MRPNLRSRSLRAVQPNAGIAAAYKRAIDKQIDAMHKSVLYWLRARYRQNPPLIARDELPSQTMKRAISAMAKRWNDNFATAAERLAAYFMQDISDRSDDQLRHILREGGFSVRFKATRAQRDVLRATINESVALIRSIPAIYFPEIEAAVMRAMMAGHDLERLTTTIDRRYDVTRKRAILISRDQTNKATAALTRARHLELGITTAVWMHSGAGKEPRPTHVAMSGKTYDIKQGMWDEREQRFVLPGELINCRCTSRPVISGFS